MRVVRSSLASVAVVNNLVHNNAIILNTEVLSDLRESFPKSSTGMMQDVYCMSRCYGPDGQPSLFTTLRIGMSDVLCLTCEAVVEILVVAAVGKERQEIASGRGRRLRASTWVWSSPGQWEMVHWNFSKSAHQC